MTIEGKTLPAGRYGLHMIPTADEWTLIFSKDTGSWGSFFYEESHDALRVQVKPQKHDYREWLTYEFTERRPTQATVELQWEDLSVPFKIKVDNANEIYISKLKQELPGVPGFDYKSYDAAAQFLLQSKTNPRSGAPSGRTPRSAFPALGRRTSPRSAPRLSFCPRPARTTKLAL